MPLNEEGTLLTHRTWQSRSSNAASDISCHQFSADSSTRHRTSSTAACVRRFRDASRDRAAHAGHPRRCPCCAHDLASTMPALAKLFTMNVHLKNKCHAQMNAPNGRSSRPRLGRLFGLHLDAALFIVELHLYAADFLIEDVGDRYKTIIVFDCVRDVIRTQFFNSGQLLHRPRAPVGVGAAVVVQHIQP